MMPDIDLDFPDRDIVLSKIRHVPAVMKDNKKHNTGVYCHEIPVNPLTGYASIGYEPAEERGYFKIDFLNVSAYKGVRDEVHIKELLSVEPLWDLMYEKDVCDQLFHINGYHTLLADLKPKSISELAMVLALIRPGKKHLLPICKEKGFEAIKDEIWTRNEEAYFFKKSHAVGYAHLIVMQLNLICEQLSYEYS
jgi:hypothetical protein